MLMLGTHNVSYVIGQKVVKLEVSTINKYISSMNVGCFKMPNASYTNRYCDTKSYYITVLQSVTTD